MAVKLLNLTHFSLWDVFSEQLALLLYFLFFMSEPLNLGKAELEKVESDKRSGLLNFRLAVPTADICRNISSDYF